MDHVTEAMIPPADDYAGADEPVLAHPWADGVVMDYDLGDAVPVRVLVVLIALILCGVTWLAVAG